MRYTIVLLLIGFVTALSAQVNFTANDQVPEFYGDFGYGTNMGVYEGWNDIDLANIIAGNPSLGIKGLGVNTLRPSLPEWFLSYWGYDIRKEYFQHYKDLGLTNLTVFIGYPTNETTREEIEHCPGKRSFMFKNMYTDIWDNGQNGTPVNEENYYAVYVYKMVQQYKFNVKFWEVLNEPDFDLVGNSSLPKDDPKSWWNVNPDPCESGLKAPIHYYIRMLRISYEVIKTLDPDAYVSIAGLGYPSFLDAVLRQTDNPNGGTVTEKYPKKGAAYFDVMCYHAYPHFDGSMRYWSNDAGGFVYTRHSDSAADGVANKKDDFEEVLKDYGYDGSKFPEKKWIITESNIPRKAFGEYIGSDEAQRNFTIKVLVQCQKRGILQYDIYSLAERRKYNEANQEFDVMGLFKALDHVEKYQHEPTDQGIAFATTTNLLKGKKFDTERTNSLSLPNNIDGAAFKDPSGKYVYVLWAKTQTDRSENASAKYTIPNQFRNGNFELRQWDFHRTNSKAALTGVNIQLSGAPIFISELGTPLSSNNINGLEFFKLKVLPNPIHDEGIILFSLNEKTLLSIDIFDLNGRKILPTISNQIFSKGQHNVRIDMNTFPKGVYTARLQTSNRIANIKFVNN